ncbi:hypothetical protein KFU94_03310 [Chloroflexi bacterium TSY]|nr:hypothetical protein [Chloroflexi bacterium TSY]
MRSKVSIILYYLLFPSLVLIGLSIGYLSYPLLNSTHAGLRQETVQTNSSVTISGVSSTAAQIESWSIDGVNLGSDSTIASNPVEATNLSLPITDTVNLTATEFAAIDLAQIQIYKEAWDFLEQDFYGEKPTVQKRIYATMRGMIQSFEDPNTFFIEPQPRILEHDQLRGSFGGVGAYIETDDQGYKLRPMRDQPAERAGVPRRRPSDRHRFPGHFDRDINGRGRYVDSG